MISFETIIVNSQIKTAFILCYYEGIKEEVSLEGRTIYLWYDYLDDASGEYWLEIIANTEQLFVNYLRNIIGIRELIDNSTVYMCNREYENYSEIKRIKKMEKFDGIELPDNEFLGHDFWNSFFEEKVKKTIFNESAINILEESITTFTQLIIPDIQHFKLKEIETDDAHDELFYQIAA